MKPIWILVNCNSQAEADKIGRKILNSRLAGCFDILKREASCYFWPPTASLAQNGGPPKSGKIEKAKGCVLILTTLDKHTRDIHKLIKKNHSDKVPFIGSIELKNVNPDYLKWIKAELTKK